MSEILENKKRAIVLFNLGGPDSLGSVREFLFNLFYDPRIIKLPDPFRWILAKIISFFREKKAKGIYSRMGGGSPILEQTLSQKEALKRKLMSGSFGRFDIFVCMRHFKPKSEEIAKEILRYGPDEIICLPLYPQFSTTTTLSSVEDFRKSLSKAYGARIPPLKEICCYPAEDSFLASHISLIKKYIGTRSPKDFRILFSAHSLPSSVIKEGDPYEFQIGETVKNIVAGLGVGGLDYKITYQSKVGPLKWLEPYTEAEIKKARDGGKDLVIVPISFVSEHSETLVELDIEYKKLYEGSGLDYIRVEALCVEDFFIKALASLIYKAARGETKKICPPGFRKCFRA